MWFNSMLTEEPYQGLTCTGRLLEIVVASSEAGTQVLHGCRQLVP